MKTKTIADVLTELVPKKGKNKSDVARRLGISSQLLGQYMNGRHEPKLAFYEAWEREFGEKLKTGNERIVSHETSVSSDQPPGEGSTNFQGLLLQLMKMQNHLLEKQNKILEDTKDLVSSKMSGIEQSLSKIDKTQDLVVINLTEVHDDVLGLMGQQRSGFSSMMDSLDRIEGNAPGTIAKEASNVEFDAEEERKGGGKKKAAHK